jgi:hypothetical protein
MGKTTFAKWIAAGAAAALCIAASPAFADAATNSPASRTALQLRIVIPTVVRAAGLSHPERLEIGAQDIERGYVDVDDATSLSLTSNSRSGYSVSAAFDASVLSRVDVRIQGQNLAFTGGQGNGAVNAPRMTDAPVNVGYRLYFSAGTVAGRYRWPVVLSFGTTA